jgi:integrase/recombinase XerD
VQQFPIQYEVGEAIIRYLKAGRPKCDCPYLFTTFVTPYRAMRATCLWKIVAARMRKLGIESTNSGPHSLRHACATKLLREESSLRDIADFPGHRGLNAVSIYAKYDPRLLRQVASFSVAREQ